MNMTMTPLCSMLATSGWPFVSQFGAAMALGLAAFGSAVGIGMAGRAAAGAWAKEAKAGQTLRFTYIILLGLPLSQTLYGFIVMNKLGDVMTTNPALAVTNVGMMLSVGLATGIAEMLSAWMQGLIGAAGIRAMSDGEGKGFAFIIIAMGIVETVGIFAMVFLLGLITKAEAVAEPAGEAVSMLYSNVTALLC